MKKKFHFILMNTLILMGSHSAFSMQNTEEDNIIYPSSPTVPLQDSAVHSPIEDQYWAPDRMSTFFLFRNGTPKQKAEAFTTGGQNFDIKLLSWVPRLSPEIKERICSNLTHILENYPSTIDHIRAGQLLLNFGTPEQKEASAFALMALAKSSSSFEDRMEATLCLFCNGTSDQKAAGFTVGGRCFSNKLSSWIPAFAPEVKDQICSDLTHILESHPSEEDRIRAGHLLLNFGTPEQKEISISVLMALAQSSSSFENRMDVMFYIFRDGSPEQKAMAFTTGGMDFYNELLFWVPTLPPESKEHICLCLTYILKNHVSATDRIRAGHLLLNFGMPKQKEISVSALMAFAKNSSSFVNRMDATFYIFRDGTPEQKKEAFTAGGMDFCNELLSWIPQLSPGLKEQMYSNLTHILESHPSEEDRIRAGQLLLIFGTPQQKEASVSALMAYAKSSSSLENRMDATFYIFRDGPPEQKAAVFTVGGQNFAKDLLSWIPQGCPEDKKQICSDLTHILENHPSATDRIRAGQLLLNFGTQEQKEASISALKVLAQESELL